MENFDNAAIGFDPNQLNYLNIILALLMFSVSLNFRFSDLLFVFKQPQKIIIGLISQWILLPTITLVLIYFLRPDPSLALGMILISVCPGGNVSNYAVDISKGNLPLSVALTSISTIGAIILTPITFHFWSQFYPETNNLMQAIYVNPMNMIIAVFIIIGVPIIIGSWLNANHPNIVKKIRKPVKIGAMVLFLGFVIVVGILNYNSLRPYISNVLYLVVLHNISAILIGYYFAKINGLNKTDSKTIAIETGIQNSGLGLMIIFNFFDGLGGMALIAAWWGIWHMISVFSLAFIWGRNKSI